jgi:hypothetical protein
LVAKCAEANWQINFRRMLNPDVYEEWTRLQELLVGVLITDEEDEIGWALSSSRCFTTSSLYKFLTTGGLALGLQRRFGSAECH